MAALPDSMAYFNARAAEYQVPEELMAALQAAGVRTMAHMAFSIARPGQEFDEEKFDDWLRAVNGGVMPTLGAVAAVRRLHFEAEIVVTSVLRSSVDQPSESSAPKPLPYAERTARMRQLRGQFPGLNVDGLNEPAQALLDECVFQYENRLLRYIEPAKCNSREAEVMVGKSDRKLRIEANSLSVRESKNTPDEDVSNAYKLQQCLRRRAVAYEFAGLISFTVHEQYIDRLMRRLNTEPPPNYQATSLNQILRADREVWVHLAQQVDDVRPKDTGERPLDQALQNALSDYNVAFHLLPLPLSHTANYAPYRARDNAQPRDESIKGSFQHKKGKGKHKSSSKGSSVAPRGIQGAVGRDARGRAICFNYNLSTCDQAPAGGTCSRGRHICFKANCFKNHPFNVAHKDELPKQGSD